MEKKIFNKRSEVMNIENNRLLLNISAGLNENLEYTPKIMEVNNLKDLKTDILSVLKSSIERMESLLIEHKDDIVNIENERIIIQTVKGAYRTIYMNYYKDIINYYNIFIDTSETDLEEQCFEFENMLYSNRLYFMLFVNDIINVDTLCSYDRCYIMQYLVGRW